MLQGNRIARWLWSAVALVTLTAAAVAADPVPAAPQPMLPPPLPLAESIPVPSNAAGKVTAPEPRSEPTVPTETPAATASPLPQAETIPAEGATHGNGTCPQCHVGCCCVDCRELPFGWCVQAPLSKPRSATGWQLASVLYHYDFCDETACDGFKLNAKGYERLQDIARMFPCSNFQPIIIETTPQNAKLDAARREYVWKLLVQLNVSVPDQLVVVGHPLRARPERTRGRANSPELAQADAIRWRWQRQQ